MKKLSKMADNVILQSKTFIHRGENNKLEEAIITVNGMNIYFKNLQGTEKVPSLILPPLSAGATF